MNASHDCSDDDDCYSVQLEGSDLTPRAAKTILRQRFTMRRYNLEKDGRLTNQLRAMDRPVDSCAAYTGAPGPSPDTTQSIVAILQPHTSSPSLFVIARAMASLMATNSSDSNLNLVLSAHLDSLAICPPTKQAIIPALLGMAKFGDVHAQARSVAQPQDVIEPQGSSSHSRAVISATSVGGANASYQMYRRPFGSASGSGHTVWYFSRSDSSVQSPPVISQSEPGHLYVHFDTATKTHQYWMVAGNGQWESVAKGAEYPHNHGRVLSIRSNGEPSWVLRATIGTTEIRKERRAASTIM
ncbi:hypothetical protein BC827DRAFT_1249679 [Russula dissimulans]|nr:hypothetical protein BC827DRAFT_1249679 [Russula dissimulans]